MTGAGLEPVATPRPRFWPGARSGASGSAITALMEGTRRCSWRSGARIEGRFRNAAARCHRPRSPPARCCSRCSSAAPPTVGKPGRFCECHRWRAMVEPIDGPCRPGGPCLDGPRPPRSSGCALSRRSGLGGEIRPVAGVERRLVEAARQGFRRVFLSARSQRTNSDLEVIGLEGISELTQRLAA